MTKFDTSVVKYELEYRKNCSINRVSLHLKYNFRDNFFIRSQNLLGISFWSLNIGRRRRKAKNATILLSDSRHSLSRMLLSIAFRSTLMKICTKTWLVYNRWEKKLFKFILSTNFILLMVWLSHQVVKLVERKNEVLFHTFFSSLNFLVGKVYGCWCTLLTCRSI